MASSKKLAQQEDERWIWRALKDGQPVDPSMAPSTAEEHRKRLEKTEWGPFLARLAPVIVKGVSVSGMVSVWDELSKESLEVPEDVTVPLREGCIILETMSKFSIEANWLDARLRNHLEKQRAKAKQGSLFLDSIDYVRSSLMRTSITGPSFVDSNGKEHKHRRTETRNAEPSKGVTTSTHFAVQDLVSYLPAWEAVLHKKCGLYQDYYLVHWEDEVADLQYTESGSDVPGCSWEPDECVPDDLDTIRMKAKTNWLQGGSKLNSDMVIRKPAKRFYVEPEVSVKRRKFVMTLTSNPRAGGRPIHSDFHNPFLKHGWKETPPVDDRTRDEAMIKSGWPTKESDYPKGYKPAYPPGPCTEACTCMQDWHLGKQDFEDKEQDKPKNKYRADNGAAGLNAFSQSPFVEMPEGSRFFRALQSDMELVRNQFRTGAAYMQQTFLNVLREFTQQIPIHAFVRDEDTLLCEVLVPALVSAHLDGGLMPSRYELSASLQWLSMEPSGELHVIAEPPELPVGTSETVELQLVFDHFPKFMFKQEFKLTINNIGPEKENEVELLQRLTKGVMSEMQKSSVDARLRRHLESRLSAVFDCTTGVLKDHSLGSWLKAIWEAAQVAQVCSTSHV